MTNEPDDFRQMGGLAGERQRETRKSFGKDAPIASLVSAPLARQTGVDDNLRSLSGQIPKRSRVKAVKRFGLRAASWTAGRLPAVHRDRPNVISALDADDVQVWRGGP
jgi:hypothetical protein